MFPFLFLPVSDLEKRNWGEGIKILPECIREAAHSMLFLPRFGKKSFWSSSTPDGRLFLSNACGMAGVGGAGGLGTGANMSS